MPTYIDTTNLSPATISTLQGPIITQIQITTSAYVVKDDTAVSTAGGYIKITGANFTAGTQVVIGTAAATSVTFVNSTTLNVQVPAQAAGTYVVYVTTNTGSVAILVNGLTYSGDPVWVTGSTLTGGQVDTAISIQLSATGDAPVTYALQAGSSLPPGVTLSSGGLLSGTVTGITSETVYNFTIEAIDGQAQESPRTFSITITANDQYFEYVTSLLSAATPTSTFVTDASTNAFAVTVNGDTRPSNFGPYTPGYYSGYFDGTGDYLTLSPGSAFAFGTGDFTVECWYYPTSTPTYGYVVDARNSGQTNTWAFAYGPTGVNPGDSGKLGWFDGSTILQESTVSTRTNSWNHLCYVRSGTTGSLFVNGVRVATATNSTNINVSPTTSYICQRYSSAADNMIFGYISNLRTVKGTAVYDPTQSTLTVPTAPLTAIANTSLLTCQSNRFIDNSTNNFTITKNGDTAISGFDPFLPDSNFAGRGSGFFDGTGDYLNCGTNAAYAMGTGDFTWEAWIYFPSGASYRQVFSTRSTNGSSTTAGSLAVNTSNGLSWYTNAFIIDYTTSIGVNQWVHVAVSRSGTTLRVFANGVQVGSATNSDNLTANTFTIGANNDGTEPFNGYISNVRVVKGTAVYTTAFTPPATPLTAIANTSLLTLQNNQPNNNSMFLDSSTNNFNVTRNGNTTQGSFSPYGGGWSNYFGTSQFKLSTTGMTALGSDFTLEVWIYPTSFNDYNTIFDNRTSDGDANGLVLGLTSAAKVYFYTNAAFQITTATSISLNTWTHIALVRSGAGSGNIKIYINGVADANTATYTTSFTRTAPSIGDDWSTRSNLQYYGYLSNLRATTSALYTGSFTPSTTPLTAISGTVLLTCQSNRFIDNSFSALTMTVTGTPTIQRFNPFNPVTTTPTSYSGFFDGNGDYLSAASNAAFAPGTGDFTIECFVNLGSLTGAQGFFQNTNSTNSAITDKFWFGYGGGTGVILSTHNGGSGQASASWTPSIGVWYHVAVVRQSGTIKMFVDGVSLSVTGSTTFNGYSLGQDGISIGLVTTPYYFTGYISNLRYVVGTAVYTTNFTPPTAPLTAIANTQLLTLQSPTFTDNSANNFTLTANGDTAPRQFNPFGWTNTTGGSAAYTPALYGGSAYFDGTGDSLAVPANSSFATGTGDFTIEGWIYVTDLGAVRTICGTRTAPDTTTGWNLAVLTNGSMQIYDNTGYAATGAGSVVVNTWYHFAFVRQSNVFYSYLNGVRRASSACTRDWTQNTFWIGATGGSSEPFLGYISDIRMTKAQARYTSNFQPPIAPLTALPNTVLLNNMTGAGIYDSSMIVDYETAGNASISTSVKKYGNSSMYFDGTGDYLISPNYPSLNLGSANFTVEGWFYITSNVTTGLISKWTDGGNQRGWKLDARSNGTFTFYYSTTGSDFPLVTFTGSLDVSTWTHLALVRNGSTLTLYKNGASLGSSAFTSTIFTNTSQFCLGVWLVSTNTPETTGVVAYPGYMSDIRITNGIARYTTTFTPPTSPYIRF